ncbi:mitogen-activated protein kinase kinase kinase 18-like [Silene latifolia]|uniref:mitogen-activated protein kinase kinase kinase 18-like n=1 Tax=Silene latifolia TaxID=37657 RepID=UPI003D783EA4
MELQKQNSSSNLIQGKVIGKGSYGVVRLGFRRDNGQTLAIKSADKNSASSIEAIDNEISILRTLSSPYIVEYYGEEETTSCKSLLMEYLPKGDVARGGRVDDVEVIRSYTWCLVKALMEVHSNGIVHCDVKASNLLFGSGQDSLVKLADFGSAKKVGDRENVGFFGSPLWMAPEVVRRESQGFEADVWSLGCTVIEFFTGLPAWKFDDVHSGLFKIGYSDALPEYPDRVTELGRDFLDKCLVRDVGQRWRCDQLLQHPFLLPVPEMKVLKPSPRSILDWAHDIGVEDEDEDEDCKFGDSGRGRIAELATEVGVNWESDGWVEVRSVSPGVNLGIEDCDYLTWINLSEEINDVEISGGDDGEDCGHGGLLCRQEIMEDKNSNDV